MTKEIEFVCSHNHGRSPLAEALAKKYANSRGIDSYTFVSSGSDIQAINGMLDGSVKIPIVEVRWLVNKGLERELYNSGNSRVLREIVERDEQYETDIENLQEAGCKALNIFFNEEHENRAGAFRELDLGTPKIRQDNIVVRPDARMVLGMGRDNVEVIRMNYSDFVHPPIIETLAGYAENQEGLQFKNSYGGSFEDYLEMATTIGGYVQKSIDRIITGGR